ncbi:MAG TPA: helix-turn-helix transcriptional regulator [Jatrophihabitantaceae bacterium]|jgi:transcriptional regulator with XRE-family HTH domain
MGENLLGDYLRARRELVRPEEHGLPDLGRRRVPGLRREEVAMLAGISAEYYVRLERGRDRNPSVQVLDALSRVLGLDEESRTYLASLAGAPAPARPTVETVPRAVQALVAGTRGPAFVLGRFMDVLASNAAADLLHHGLPDNVVRHVFLDPAARTVYPDWDDVAAETVASLRASVAGHLDDARLTRLVGELSLKSAEFRTLWARQDVRAKTSGRKRVHSPEIGEVTVHWEALQVASAPGQVVVTYFAEPGTESQTRLDRLNRKAADARS